MSIHARGLAKAYAAGRAEIRRQNQAEREQVAPSRCDGRTSQRDVPTDSAYKFSKRDPQGKFDLPKSAPAVYRQRQLQDNSPFPFGKHKGVAMVFVPLSYLNWFKTQDWSGKWPAVLDYIKRKEQQPTT